MCLCICLLSLVMHAKMLQSSLILYARNEKTFYDRIILVGTYIFVDISLVYSIQTYRINISTANTCMMYLPVSIYAHTYTYICHNVCVWLSLVPVLVFAPLVTISHFTQGCMLNVRHHCI